MVTSNELKLREQMLDLASTLSWLHAKIPLSDADINELDSVLSESEYEIHQTIERIRKERNV
jgi:peptidoglycan hydrolase CwlO-like protein